MTIKINGCGCRFRQEGREPTTHEVCEHLCDDHRNEFILRKYNEDLLWNRMMESDALAMDAMNKELKDNNS